jgi:hypothetical protein
LLPGDYIRKKPGYRIKSGMTAGVKRFLRPAWEHGGPRKVYLALAQNAFLAPIAPNAPFDFARCPVNGLK